MVVYEHASVVEVPLEDLWAFHSRIDGLVALTPDWLHLRVEKVIGPDGVQNPEVLEEGAEVRLSMRPLGVGPRLSWTSRIVERERSEDRAHFRDRMIDGPFDRWEHTHRFEAVETGTLLTDRVEYEFRRPFGPLSELGRIGMEPMFRHRHRQTRVELE